MISCRWKIHLLMLEYNRGIKMRQTPPNVFIPYILQHEYFYNAVLKIGTGGVEAISFNGWRCLSVLGNGTVIQIGPSKHKDTDYC
mmetsp:Transcript_20149/g.29630  ORF Transcript_20149/g.29630 Transcript_20149/m.29630 type:complete len:85 (+) Transcript_20149:114-368(+)